MSKNKLDLEVGRKYRGYGYLNEYGEFNFEPENTGSRAGVIKGIASKSGVTLSHSKNFILVHFKIPKTESISGYFVEITKRVDILVKMLRDYDF